MIGLPHYLVLSAALFSLGILGLLTRRNAVNVLMSIELIPTPPTSTSSPLPVRDRQPRRQLFGAFVIVITASEVAVTLAIVLTLYHLRRTPNLDEADILKN
jgi:NADH:ubiquinone oxidoreductase subunit K